IVARGQEFWDLVSAGDGTAGPGSYSVVFDQYGIRVAHSFKASEIFHPAAPLDPSLIEMFVADKRFGERTRELLQSPIAVEDEFSRVRNGTSGEPFRVTTPANNLVNLAVGQRLKRVPWTLFFLVPERTLEAPVRQLVNETLSTSGGILLLATLAGLLLARWTVAPVRALTSAADAIRAGDLTASVPVDSGDELGRLGSTFNTMVEALRRSRDELEDKVRERTEALKVANDALETRNEELQLEAVAPGDAVGDAVALVGPQALQRTIEIRTELSASSDVLADRGKLRQVLLNLLSNALKFSPERSVLHIGAEDAQGAVRFWVR